MQTETEHEHYVPKSIDTDIPLPVHPKVVANKRVKVMQNMKIGESFPVPSDLVQRFMDLTRRRKELRNMKFESRHVNELWKRIWRVS